MAERDTLSILAEDLGLLFEPLGDALESPSDFSSFMRELGWDFDQIPQVFNGIKPAVDALVSLVQDGNIDSDSVMGVTSQIEGVIDSVNALKNFNGALPSTVDANTFKNEFPGQLIQTLTVDYLLEQRAEAGLVLKAIGVIRVEEVDANGKRLTYVKKEIAWSDLGNFFSDPLGVFTNAYKWGTDDFKIDELLDNLNALGDSWGWEMRQEALHPLVQAHLEKNASDPLDVNPLALKLILLEDNVPPATSSIGIALQGLPKTGAEKPGISLVPFASGAIEEEVKLAESLKLLLEMGFDLSSGLAMLLRPSGLKIESGLILNSPGIPPSGMVVKAGLKYENDEGDPTVLIGSADGSRLEFQSVSFKLGGEVISNGQFDIGVETKIEGGKLVIQLGGADGFLKSITSGGGIEGSFDLLFGWSYKKGVYFDGGGGLEIEIPSHIELGPITLNGLQVGVRPSPEGIPIDLSSSITANLGPFVAVIERMGITAKFDFSENNSGNLGPLDFGVDFKPPNGIGLSLDAEVVKGGGYLFFDFEKEEYAGALELSFKDQFVLTAIGVVTTKMPDGSEGFSLLLMVSVSFSPGIALGFGFFLSGLGGLIGLHRTVDVEALRLGVKSETIDNILFPVDVVKNITKIISDIKTIFPVKKDQFVLGFMAQITWGVPKLLTVELGLIVEFSNPVRIAILGVLKCIIPTEEAAILSLQINFLGIIDFDNKYLSFDASLFNSKILTFTLEGDMALRINWGDDPGFLMSIGGFHPSYQPEKGLNVPSMKRLTLSLLSGNPSLTLTCYFAITSNTVQFGAQIDLLFKVSKFKVVGYFGFDVLFQFSPFKFIADIRAGIKIMLGSTTLFSITLEFSLQGPTPWIASGTASFKILFFTIKVKFKKTFGEKKDTSLPAVAVMPKVIEAFNAQQNWVASLPPQRFALTSIREDLELEGQIVLNPYGSLTISQNVIPLGTFMDKYGSFRPQDVSELDIISAQIGEEHVDLSAVEDNFAPANHKELDNDDKLKSPSFVKMKSGVRVTGTEKLHLNYHINRAVTYEVISTDHKPKSAKPKIRHRFKQLTGIAEAPFKLATKGGAIGRSVLSEENKIRKLQKTALVSVAEEKFKLVSKDNLSEIVIPGFNGGSRAASNDVLNNYLKAHPEEKGRVQLVPEYQLQD